MQTVNVCAAKTHFSRLVDRAAAGEEIIIAKAGRPVAKLVPLTSHHGRPKRRLGAWQAWPSFLRISMPRCRIM